MNPWTREGTSRNDAQSCYIERYLQKHINYVQRQMNYPQKQLNYTPRIIQRFSKIHCPLIEQKAPCEAHGQKPEHCKNCLVWEWQQFQKINL